MAGEDKKIKRVWDLSDLALVFFMFGTLLVLIIPVHQIMMDMLLGVSPVSYTHLRAPET